MAALFREATAGKPAVVLEVDGLSANRNHATRSCEINQVNELLHRIEEFEDMLFATTNRLEMIDPAVLRRFDAKIRFDYMKAEYAADMFCQMLDGAEDIRGWALPRLTRIGKLTPGDFTSESVKFAAGRNIELIDGKVLAAGLRETRPAKKIEPILGDVETSPGLQSIPACPSCGNAMVERVAKRGPQSGGRFWGCSDFPACWGTRKISD